MDQELKRLKKNILELEEVLFKPKKYYDYGDTENKGIRVVGIIAVMFLIIKIITSNMRAKGIKTKIYQLENILI